MNKTKGFARTTGIKGADAVTSHRSPRVSRRETLIFSTPWGWMGLSASSKGISHIILPKPIKREAESALRAATGAPLDGTSSPHLQTARAQLLGYLAGTRRSFALPLDVSEGTAFQRRVWRALRRVPYGTLRPYQWVAVLVGGHRYARAVGNAVGANPLPIVIPCHRIIALDASLGGFSGGLPTKRKLLALEGSLSQIRRDGPGR